MTDYNGSNTVKSTFTFNAAAPEFTPGATWDEYDNAAEDEVTSKLEQLTVEPTEEVYSEAESVIAKDIEEKIDEQITSREPSIKKKTSITDSGIPLPDPRQHLNIVFIGHIDAGKSTTCGNILYLSGYVDERTIEKYEREAKDRNRESWFLAFIMDTNEEERQKGKTVEVGQARIETTNKRFTMLDAPGHKNYVPNMISGATQADCGVLIVSARKGEFETGFDRGGQTREHTLLAKTLGVTHLIVAVNKMDDHTCGWSETRYNEIVQKLRPFLKTCGFVEGRNLNFVPISGLNGQNIMHHISDKSYKGYSPNAAWYPITQPTLFQLLDGVEISTFDEKAPLRIPITGSYKDNGVVCMGKVESGTITSGQNCLVMPGKVRVKIQNVLFDEDEFAFAKPGENIRLRVVGVEEDQISKGAVLCDIERPCPVVTEFIAMVQVIDLLEHRPLITAGYFCVMHAHSVVVEVHFYKLLETVDKATKKKKLNPTFVKNNTLVTAHLKVSAPICLEVFDTCPQLGRFTMRDEDKTIAVGKIMSIVKAE
ncbi:Eukaryotic peptide chain release factor GTP-binding subunit ERF3B [Babesia sp. Xinjiang]|uniref:Eukaryotic peptide chain release factor GTP-binding subunit ERF3B n=1 Tax=Babesia sp. Xinjiang TaxID=462227 RepID=UPI000A21DCF1|nr:Eukaryotic peptide chain release factor GTP-binding subunit ERF3B [Babesia sp. Xinjiang]ORM41433.1 Eukaryotic peptide chain release factor GTP-binding subunit ERF3B [Babesia sp. Xinjiang]